MHEIQKMLGTEDVNPFSGDRITEILPDNPRLVTFQDFNEILAYLGERRVSEAFFQHFWGQVFQSVEALAASVDKVRIFSMLFFGNFKQGFRYLSQISASEEFNRIPWDINIVTQRPMTVDRIEQLTAERAHATGYLTGQENPLTPRQRKRAIKLAKDNAERYLAMNGVDVYVAGSMRSLSDFRDADAHVTSVRQNSEVRRLGLTFFNPLWAYMDNAQQKGLLEQLMKESSIYGLFSRNL